MRLRKLKVCDPDPQRIRDLSVEALLKQTDDNLAGLVRSSDRASGIPDRSRFANGDNDPACLEERRSGNEAASWSWQSNVSAGVNQSVGKPFGRPCCASSR